MIPFETTIGFHIFSTLSCSLFGSSSRTEKQNRSENGQNSTFLFAESSDDIKNSGEKSRYFVVTLDLDFTHQPTNF